MTDETEYEEIFSEVGVEEDHGEADWVVYNGGGTANSGQYIFPHGVGRFCEARGFSVIHVPDKPGDIYGLSIEEDRWLVIGRGKNAGKLATVK